MGLLELVVVLVLIGVGLYLLNTVAGTIIDGTILRIINIVVILVVIIWLLQALGILGSLRGIGIR